MNILDYQNESTIHSVEQSSNNSKYLSANYDKWQRGYDAENVESWVFRSYGRIFAAKLGITGAKGEKLLDWGCGAGAALSFYASKGFDVYGVDIAEPDIALCKERMPNIADHVITIDPKPNAQEVFFGGGYDVVVAIQSYYYLGDADMAKCMDCIYNQMKPGAIFYATMMGSRCYFFDHSTDVGDGLREVNVANDRLVVEPHYINFTESEDDLLAKFDMFERIHVGYYDAS